MKLKLVIPSIDVILALIYISICLAGINKNLYIIAEIVLLSLWLVIAFLNRGGNTFCRSKLFFLVIGLVVYLFILCAIASNPYNGLVYSGVRFIYLGPSLICIYYLENSNRDYVYKISMLVWSLVCIYALFFYLNNPHAARHLAIASDYYGVTVLGGGYALAYGSAILTVYLFGVLLDKDNRGVFSKARQLNIIVGCIINFFVVIQTASVITMIAMAIGLAYTAFIAIFYRRKKYAQLAVAFLVLIVLIIYVMINWSRIGYGIIALTQGSNDIVNIRFNEIGQSMIGQNAADSDFSYRIKIIENSIQMFFQKPLFGWGFSTGYDYRTGLSIGVGGHGQFTDILALHGLIGGLLFYAIYKGAIKISKTNYSSIIMRGYIITFLFLFIFNPFESFAGHFILFLIIPILAKEIATNSV